MIARSGPTWQTSTWQNQQSQAIRDPKELLKRLNLSEKQLPGMLHAGEQFPLRVTESYLSRMRLGDPNDPLLLQILPQGRELKTIDGYSLNPVGDQEAMPLPGLLHKYQGRCLLVLTAACAVHCRYCFRRHFPYQEARLDDKALENALNYIAMDDSLEEIILSGGDPLSVSDNRLAQLINQLDKIPHLKRLRIHSRQPVVLPSRVTDELLSTLSKSRLKKIIVLHFNHANEFNDEVNFALSRLADHHFTLLNQSVLLKGINDSLSTLKELSETLFEQRILPYYLHLLDKVSGSAHFDIPIIDAQKLHQQLRASLPGYLVPLLVQERAGERNKTPI